jgi:3-oxoacyl-[acyl-carrier protein] reductase
MRESCSSLFLLVNNAGIGIYGPSDEVKLADWEKLMAVNARGTLLCSQEAFSWMRATGGGRIVNISSVMGVKGYVNQAAYAASKHAIMGLTKVMAREGQESGIRVCVICPGGVATDLVKSARPDLDVSLLIQPEDVARAVLYLAKEPDTCCTDMLSLRRSSAAPFH